MAKTKVKNCKDLYDVVGIEAGIIVVPGHGEIHLNNNEILLEIIEFIA